MAELIEVIPSRERCAESGWYAYDFIFTEPLSDEKISDLRSLGGSFLFMKQLKKPFFKLESDYMVIKGVSTDSFFRVAVHDDYKNLIDNVKKWAEN